MRKGTRLDIYLAENHLSESREKAKREIIAGWVTVNAETVRDPARNINGDETITVERPGGVFVSRGGEKLDHALTYFSVDVSGKTVADLGASTGGFTDCLLKRGAAMVYAIDVGYGQLDYRLQQDSRVIVKDRTNVRNLTRGDFTHAVNFITADLSFISLSKIKDIIIDIFAPVEGLLLIKPQFEARKSEHKKGVVRKADVHKAILLRVLADLSGIGYKGLCYSPIKGPAGNIEFFLYFDTRLTIDFEKGKTRIESEIEDIVDEAHRALDT